jgi:hypothetical protein
VFFISYLQNNFRTWFYKSAQFTSYFHDEVQNIQFSAIRKQFATKCTFTASRNNTPGVSTTQLTSRIRHADVTGAASASSFLKNNISLSKFYHQLMHKRIALKEVLKFTLKQLQHVSV